MAVWKNPVYRDKGLSQAEGPELDKSQTLLRNPVTWNVMGNGVGNTESINISWVQPYINGSFRRESEEEQQVFLWEIHHLPLLIQ